MATSSGKLTCYGRNDAVETGAIPCNPQAEVSTCCGYTGICFSNGLCGPGPGMPNEGIVGYETGYCTDRSWSNGTACPSICNNQRGADIGGTGVEFCGGNSYCCYNFSFADCCETSSLMFSLEAITSSTILPNSSLSVTVTTSSYSPSTDATTTTSASTLASASLSTSHPSTNHFAAGVGAGIGIAAALLFLIGIIFIIRQRRTENRAPQIHEKPAHGEDLGITNGRTLPEIHEIDGQKPTLVEPDGQPIVEIDTGGTTGC